MNPAWDDESIRPKEAGRIARYRRLQSWYREVQLGALPGTWPGKATNTPLGSMLSDADVVAQPDLNFLHPDAYAHAVDRIRVVRGEGGALDPKRLTANMLSSMPLCFNLFGALRNAPGFLGLFQQLFDPDATSIVDVQCEWSPQPATAFLDDRTAFDAIVFYERPDGPAFYGIETKYTEPFSQKQYEPTKRYRQVTADCGWFEDPVGAPHRLKASRSNQLWRNVMLAASMELAGLRGRGSVAVVALKGDPGAAKACAAVSNELSSTGRDRLRSVSLEQIADVARSSDAELCAWANRFHRRYLDVEAPNRREQRDPAGPTLGKPLSAR